MYRKIIFVGAGLTLLLAACSVTPDPSDTTPPTISWDVYDQTQGTHTKVTGTGTATVDVDDHLIITATAADPQGMRTLTLTSNSSWSCKQGDVQSQAGPGLTVPQSTSTTPDADGKVASTLFLLQDETGGFTCQAGWQIVDAGYGFQVKAVNYAGLDATATLGVTATA